MATPSRGPHRFCLDTAHATSVHVLLTKKQVMWTSLHEWDSENLLPTWMGKCKGVDMGSPLIGEVSENLGII